MYVKLTKLDGMAIWINAAFVVTVEPRRGGGAIVVPIGDGLDYDVRETPEKVLEMLGEQPPVTVVPVPAPKGLTPTRIVEQSDGGGMAAAKSEGEGIIATQSSVAVEVPAETENVKAVTKPRRTRTKKTAGVTTAAEAGMEEKPPAKKPRTTRKKKAEVTNVEQKESAAEGVADTQENASVRSDADVASQPSVLSEPVVKHDMPLSFEQIERLRKMMPRSIRKLQNTLVSQFRMAGDEIEHIVAALVENDVILLDGSRVIWKAAAL